MLWVLLTVLCAAAAIAIATAISAPEHFEVAQIGGAIAASVTLIVVLSRDALRRYSGHRTRLMVHAAIWLLLICAAGVTAWLKWG